MDAYIRKDPSDFYPDLFLAPAAAHPGIAVNDEWRLEARIAQLSLTLPGYDRPVSVEQLDIPFPRHSDGSVDAAALDAALAHTVAPKAVADFSPTETTVAGIMSQVLSVPLDGVSRTSDFFQLGGSSLSAGQFLAKLRKVFQIRLPIDVLFTNSQLDSLAALIDERISAINPAVLSGKSTNSTQPKLLPGCEETNSSTRLLLLFLQLLPICVFYPMKRALTWITFLYLLTWTQSWPTNNSIPGRVLDLVISLAGARIVTKIVAPLVAIACKWLLLTHTEGLYPMWGAYHTRWWLCQKIISVAGFGVFGTSNMTRVWYYRLLGAKVGCNVTINKGATIGEFDLVTIGDNAILERCIVRPFAAERNTSMYLGSISVGANAVVGLGSIVAPGTQVPDNACIGPNSSSWEADYDEANRDLASSRIMGPHWLLTTLVCYPLQMLTAFIGAIPWLSGLIPLVAQDPKNDTADMLREVVIWFSGSTRVGYHLLALCLHVLFGPACVFLLVWLIKLSFDRMIGSVRPSHGVTRSHVEKTRDHLLRTLMPSPQFHKFADLFGTHYEGTSILARMLGAEVGKHVYWPGTGPSVQDFGLLKIGDDVVFGSRSHLVTSDGAGSDYVRIGMGAMVADRVVLLPGVELGEKTVMGSGALTKRNRRYASGSTFVGSRRNDAVCLSIGTKPNDPSLGNRSGRYEVRGRPDHASYTESTETLFRNFDSESSSITLVEQGIDLRDLKGKSSSITISAIMAELDKKPADVESSSPFGRAFYQGLAPYRVWSQVEIFGYCTLITVVCAVFWNISSISAVQIVGHAYRHHSAAMILANTRYRPVSLYLLFTAIIAIVMAAQAITVLAFLIAMKWLLLGRRKSGNYDWDKSSYCQRWQLFLKLESLRRHCYGGHGILEMLTGTAWIVWYFQALGMQAGKDCALFAGGRPSLLFTEADLLTLGDRVSVDDASLVGHINTRGKFDLNPLSVGDRSVLRSGSRLLSGARMEADTCLLEHTLVMAGDVVEAGCTSQGWPAEEFNGSRTPTLKVGQVWEKA